MIETLSIQDLKTSYDDLRTTCGTAREVSLMLPAAREELKKIEAAGFSAGLLDDQEAAQKLLQERSRAGKKD